MIALNYRILYKHNRISLLHALVKKLAVLETAMHSPNRGIHNCDSVSHENEVNIA